MRVHELGKKLRVAIAHIPILVAVVVVAAAGDGRPDDDDDDDAGESKPKLLHLARRQLHRGAHGRPVLLAAAAALAAGRVGRGGRGARAREEGNQEEQSPHFFQSVTLVVSRGCYLR